MKKLAILFCFLLVFCLSYSSQSQSIAGGGDECKSQIIDCAGWFTGDRVVCLKSGKGVSCNCGASSDCQ